MSYSWYFWGNSLKVALWLIRKGAHPGHPPAHKTSVLHFRQHWKNSSHDKINLNKPDFSCCPRHHHRYHPYNPHFCSNFLKSGLGKNQLPNVLLLFLVFWCVLVKLLTSWPVQLHCPPWNITKEIRISRNLSQTMLFAEVNASGMLRLYVMIHWLLKAQGGHCLELFGQSKPRSATGYVWNTMFWRNYTSH